MNRALNRGPRDEFERDVIRRQISLFKSFSSAGGSIDEVSSQDVDKSCSIAQLLEKKKVKKHSEGFSSMPNSPREPIRRIPVAQIANLPLSSEKKNSRTAISSLVSPRFIQSKKESSRERKVVEKVCKEKEEKKNDGSPYSRFRNLNDDIIRSLEIERQRLYEEYLALEDESEKKIRREKKREQKKRDKEEERRKSFPLSPNVSQTILSPRSPTYSSFIEQDDEVSRINRKKNKENQRKRAEQLINSALKKQSQQEASSMLEERRKLERGVILKQSGEEFRKAELSSVLPPPVLPTKKCTREESIDTAEEKERRASSMFDEAFRGLKTSILESTTSENSPDFLAFRKRNHQVIHDSRVLSSPRILEEKKMRETFSYSSKSPLTETHTPRSSTTTGEFISSLSDKIETVEKKRIPKSRKELESVFERLSTPRSKKSSPQKEITPPASFLAPKTIEMYKDTSYDFMRTQTQFLEAKKANLERLRQKQVQEEEKELQKSISPTINRPSKTIESKIHSLMNWHNSTLEKRKRMQEKLDQEEMKDFTFKPMLSPRTTRMTANTRP